MLVDNMGVDQPEDDQDSLFGSPPASPIRGRSPFPSLALPSTSASFALQNVGTIALPGSHHYSELPVHPLALSLSHAHQEPPRPSPNLKKNSSSYLDPPSTSPCPSPTIPLSKSRKRPSKRLESTSRSLAPPIPLPDPSDPPPANFLRNQLGLLGTAGLVAGIKPSRLSTHRHARGANALNPIVVEDEPVPPTIDSTKFRGPPTHSTGSTLLPVPSFQDIMAVLVSQKDVIPILQNFVKLISSGSGLISNASSFHSTSSKNPPSRTSNSFSQTPPQKKRKLNHVPAGAVDWDVPFPFPQGEGPEEYRKNWERERTKQLWFQLVALVRSAMQKAAAKNYLQNGGATRAIVEAQQLETSNFTNVNSGPQPMTPFDQLVSSLLSTASDKSSEARLVIPTPTPTTDRHIMTTNQADHVGSSNDADQGLVDSWTNILQTLPLPLEESTPYQDLGTSRSSTVSTEEDFGYIDIDPSLNFDVSCLELDSLTQCAGLSSSLGGSKDCVSRLTQENIVAASRGLCSDHLIDPSLLAISIPQPDAISTPSLIASPIPSTSSGEELDSTTPNSATWDLNIPEVSLNDLSRAQDAQNQDKGKGGDMEHLALPTSATSVTAANLVSTTPTPYASTTTNHLGLATLTSALPTDPPQNSEKLLNRADILKRAAERRTELLNEIDRAKTQLWETTIEQGVLVHMIKQFSNIT